MVEQSNQPAVALVHEWLTEWGGSEDVIRNILNSIPNVQLFATIDYLSNENRQKLNISEIKTTFLQHAPFVKKSFWNYIPLTPLAVETHDVSSADIIVSSSHAFAKGVLTHAQQMHISYVYSPMRYAWDLHQQYMRDYSLSQGLKGYLARWIFHKIRQWDRQTSNNVDLYVAISKHVQKRIWRTYRRHSCLIYPPVRVHNFSLCSDKDDYYLTVSRLVSYKRVDLMLEAFRMMPHRKLVVIGDGPEFKKLKSLCPPNVELKGRLPDKQVQEYLESARAFIFAAHEDFGISPVEAQACGTPVIAYGVGGSVETVRDVRSQSEPTGLLFFKQTAKALSEAVDDFDALSSAISAENCRKWAEQFSEERFQRELKILINESWNVWTNDPLMLERKLLSAHGNFV